jgi:hypothetical protein
MLLEEQLSKPKVTPSSRHTAGFTERASQLHSDAPDQKNHQQHYSNQMCMPCINCKQQVLKLTATLQLEHVCAMDDDS